jgi:hypothetical protein
MTQRYVLEQSTSYGGYKVVDRSGNYVVFRSYSKSEAIAKSQELNYFTPIDGDEATYALQTKQVREPE